MAHLRAQAFYWEVQEGGHLVSVPEQAKAVYPFIDMPRRHLAWQRRRRRQGS